LRSFGPFFGLWIRVEAVAEVPSQRPPECLGIADSSQPAGARPRADRLRQLAESAPQRRQVGAAGGVAENHAENGSGPGEEEVRGQPQPLVNVLPAEQDEV